MTRPAPRAQPPAGPVKPPLLRRTSLWGLERALRRCGFSRVAGVDEAGRGACAGPLVVAAVVLRPGPHRSLDRLADSKLLVPRVREELYTAITRIAQAWHVVTLESAVIDARGVHVCNLEGMRRAVAGLSPAPSYVLSDGFAVPGLPVPAVGVIKGDQVAACVAAASILAKVTRDRLMTDLDSEHPGYGFAQHKGYVTGAHQEALHRLGPCPQHRFSYANVARARVGDNAVMAANDREGTSA